MAKKFWKIALGVGCAAVLLAIIAVVALVLGLQWLEGEMQRQAAEPLTALELQECELVRDGSSVTVRGSVLNGGRGTVGSTQLAIHWTDGSGSEIGQDSVYTTGAGGVAPGEASEFQLVRDDPSDTIAGADCRIVCVSTQQAQICY